MSEPLHQAHHRPGQYDPSPPAELSPVRGPQGWSASGRWPSFTVLALATTLAVTLLLVAISLDREDGVFTYVIDDAAIHMAVVENILEHRTWGVEAGRFESASSSPGWTLLLVPIRAALPPLGDVLPVVVNLVAAAWIIRLLARRQGLLGSDLGPASVVTVPILVAVGLFLPSLALVGMEHTLHAALVLQALVVLEKLQFVDLTVRGARTLLLTVFVAALYRYETLFLVVGLAVGLLAGTSLRLGAPAVSRWTRASAVRVAAAVGTVAVLPPVAFGVVSVAFGGLALPNSVLAKSRLREGRIGRDPVRAASELLLEDPLLAALALVAIAYLLFAWQREHNRHVVVASAFVATVVTHAVSGNYGGRLGFMRYQAYLVVAGVYVLLSIAEEVVPRARRRAAAGVLLVGLLTLGMSRLQLLIDTPLAASNTYRQRYQLARFVERSYANETVATSELGYTALRHEGEIVDLLGLGDAEVLRLRGTDWVVPAEELGSLLRERGVAVVAAHPETLAVQGDPGWILVAEWQLRERKVTARDPLQFWALDESGAAKLDARMRAFEPSLPSRVRVLHRSDLSQRSERRRPAERMK